MNDSRFYGLLCLGVSIALLVLLVAAIGPAVAGLLAAAGEVAG